MKKIVILILTVLVFSWTSAVSAGNGSGKQSPESIVSCATQAHPYRVLGDSLPETINAEQCRTHPDGGPDLCSSCINSLENQGCKIVDVVVETMSEVSEGRSSWTNVVTYMLSCVKP